MKKLLLPLLLASPLVSADLLLDKDVSQLNFGSIKNNTVAELHRFTTLSGEIDRNGKAVITVDLASVDTRIDIRDQRMKEHLFQVTKFPSAVYTASIDIENISDMEVGNIQQRRLKGELDLHGHKKPLELLVRIVRGTGGAFTVFTVEPAFISVSDFALGAGVDKLQEIAGLSSITRAVPVTFSAVFREKEAEEGEDEGDKEESPLKKVLPF
ncbi:polyisoprenoid-binding protein YceI [Litorivivens lipolytica]|uniref:Polyisoprenoid-binding protein YceI n=1 Tax=Litorivivens lipolytica TaxID=1524264 RepID=A0A7W4Z602_9GAMM|nr:YceI family protein [Litorivivens lipolytica]MBB3046426.1 polyisoprenoid-binding protein YceI [Litorivivens lipolytica]